MRYAGDVSIVLGSEGSGLLAKALLCLLECLVALSTQDLTTMHFKCCRPRMAFNTSRCQVRNQNANTVFDIMGASIGKSGSCPSFQHTHFVLICGT